MNYEIFKLNRKMIYRRLLININQLNISKECKTSYYFNELTVELMILIENFFDT